MKDSKKQKPIDLDEDQRSKLSRMAADLPGLMEYAHTVGGFAIVPEKDGVIRSKAMQAMTEQTQMALDQIKEQMLLLAKQAQDLKRRVEVSAEIYAAKMSFHPQIGLKYYDDFNARIPRDEVTRIETIVKIDISL